jgi:hypothetical protein
MSLFGVIVQPVDGEVTPEHLERYGEVVDIPALMESDDKGRDFCDGQTSALPPEYADDQGGMIFCYDRATAEYWSGVARHDLAGRAAAGDIVLPDTLSWLTSAQTAAQAATYAETVLAAETLPATIAEVREGGILAGTITDSQIRSQIQAYVAATGNATPSIEDLLEWITDNAPW